MIKRITLSIFSILVSYCGYSQNPCPNVTSEKVVNGNFNAGNTGFTSDYTYITPSGNTSGGDYGVGANPNAYNTGYFATMGDHTTGTGNFLIADGDATTTAYVWQESVSVTAGQTYFFSAWFANIDTHVTGSDTCYDNPAQLQFQIAGVNIGSAIQIPCHNHNWVQFFTTWTAPTTTTINLTIQDILAQGNGNDFGLDDISFTTGCGSLSNLSSFGSNASIMDTLYECDYNFASGVTVTSGLPTSGYTYAWKNSALADLSGTYNQNSYTFNAAPTPGKYYLCYDTAGCWKADSFIVSNTLNFDMPPNQNLCPPVDYTITPTPVFTAAGLTYSWELGGTAISGATMSTYEATQDGVYKLMVKSASCGQISKQMTITSPSSALAGSVTCASGEYQFSGTAGTYNTISGTPDVAWYTTPSGGTAITPTTNVSARVPATGLVSAPGCALGGLYAQDLNSFYTVLGPATAPCPASTQTQNITAGQMQITIATPVTLTSLDFIQLNYSTGSTETYNVNIYNDNSGSMGATLLFSGAGSTWATTLTAVTRTLSVGYTFAAGTYWIELGGTGEYAYSTCGAFPYSNSPNPGIAQITKGILNSGAGNLPAFNLKLTVGTPNPCSRIWVCESASCPAPVKFLYVNAENENGATTINWATASEQNNAYFIVQKSPDGISFINIDTIAGAGNSSSILTYSYIDRSKSDGTSYYRIEQVDLNGDNAYTDIVAVTSTTSNLAKIYPVPVKEGGDLTVDFNSSENQLITISIVDIIGKAILKLQKSILKGDNAFILPTLGLSRGTYLVELVSQSGENTVQRIVIN